jgi:hypothetical protein
MQHRILSAVSTPVLLTVAGLTGTPTLHAQAAAVSGRPIRAAMQVGALSRERASRWAGAAPVIYCAPAPLTERPGVAAEFARPHVAPLEEAFLDAAVAKRTFVGREP